jgi:hypothetical protein
VSNLAHAIALLGTTPMAEASQRLPALEEYPSGIHRKALLDCYARAGHAAWYARQWGLMRGDQNPEEMAIAALLHECGEMALWNHATEKMLKIRQLTDRGISRENASIRVLGFTLDQLSRGLAKRWFVCELTADALEPAGAFRPRALGVMLATALARESAASWYSESTLELLELLAGHNRMPLDKTIGQAHSLAAAVGRNLRGLPVPLSIHGLITHIPKTEASPATKAATAGDNRVADKTAMPTDNKPPPVINKAPDLQARRERALTTNRIRNGSPVETGGQKPAVLETPGVTTVVNPQTADKPAADTKEAVRGTKASMGEPKTESTPTVAPQVAKNGIEEIKAETPSARAEASQSDTANQNSRAESTSPQIVLPKKERSPGKTAFISGQKAKPEKTCISLEESLTLVFKQLRNDVGMERVLYAALTPDNRLLKSRFVIGTQGPSPLQQLKIPMQQRHIFSLLMKKPQGLWLNHVTREKILPYIPDALQEALNCDGFFVSSVFAKHKPAGILYGDCSDPNSLDSRRFKQFKILAQHLSNELGQR